MCKGQEEEEEDEKEKQGQEGKSGRNNTSADESAFFSESNTNTDDAGSGCESGDELPRAPYHANEHTQHTRRSDSKWDSESDSESRWSSDDSASTSEEEYESDESADLQAERALLNLDTTTTTTTSSGSRLDCVQRGHVTTALCL